VIVGVRGTRARWRPCRGAASTHNTFVSYFAPLLIVWLCMQAAAMPSGEIMHSPSLSPINTKRAPSCGPPSGPPSLVQTPRTVRRGGDEECGQEAVDVHDWVRTVLVFLEKNGQEILQAICTRYKIPYDRSITSIPIGTWEQVASFSLVSFTATCSLPAPAPCLCVRLRVFHTFGAVLSSLPCLHGNTAAADCCSRCRLRTMRYSTLRCPRA
jgi:hypothetical protein